MGGRAGAQVTAGEICVKDAQEALMLDRKEQVGAARRAAARRAAGAAGDGGGGRRRWRSTRRRRSCTRSPATRKRLRPPATRPPSSPRSSGPSALTSCSLSKVVAAPGAGRVLERALYNVVDASTRAARAPHAPRPRAHCAPAHLTPPRAAGASSRRSWRAAAPCAPASAPPPARPPREDQPRARARGAQPRGREGGTGARSGFSEM